MKYDKSTRRMFLNGCGKSMLAIPLLPSLLPRIAQAQALNIPPRYMFMFLTHGPVKDYWYPADRSTLNKQVLFPANGQSPIYEIAAGPISSNATTGMSYLFDQKFHAYRAKMTFLQGLDTPTLGGHHWASGVIGNLNGAHASNSQYKAMPTIDHIMAYAPGFYPNGGNGFARQILTGFQTKNEFAPIKYNYMSHGFQNALQRSGAVTPVDSIYYENPLNLFNYIFSGFAPPTGPAPTTSTPIVDEVLADYRSLRNGRAISSSDRLLLDTHIDLLAQLEQKLTTPPPTLSCTLPQAPASMPGFSDSTDPNDLTRRIPIINDIIFAAFRCGITRLASFQLSVFNTVDNGTSLHRHAGSVGYDDLHTRQKVASDLAVYDMVRKLDSVTESNGRTMLDNSILHYAAATGPAAHIGMSHPCVLFGSAGGRIKTNQYIDYRMQNPVNLNTGIYANGLLQNQLLVTIMQLMGLPPSAYNMSNLGILPAGYDPATTTYGEFAADNDATMQRRYYKYTDPIKIAGNILPLL